MMKKKPIKRSKNLNDELIETIVGILDAWSGKLTWDLLIEETRRITYQEYTRQALFGSERIKNAFILQKKRLPFVKTQGKKLFGHEEIIESERNARLLAENARLKDENQRLLEQFSRWAYNSQVKNISIEDLNRPLPKIYRV